MTRQDAIEYDNWLKSGLMQEAEVLGLGEKAGSDLADRYITVIPVTRGKEGFSGRGSSLL